MMDKIFDKIKKDLEKNNKEYEYHYDDNFAFSGQRRHIIVRFPNNYGASIVHHFGSYGNKDNLLEIAVLNFKDLKNKNPIERNIGDYELCYTTPITDDVLGYVEPDDVPTILKDIESLERTVV